MNSLCISCVCKDYTKGAIYTGRDIQRKGNDILKIVLITSLRMC